MAALFLSASPPIRRIHKAFVLALLSLGLSGCESLLFFPQQQLLRTPADVGLKYRDVRIAVGADTHLHGWWLPAEGEALATVLFAHGNAENISTHLASVYWLQAQRVNVLLIDYRGYGRSAGRPSVVSAQEDILTSLAWLQNQSSEQETPILVLGQSLGASLAGVVVARHRSNIPNLAGVILDASFTGYSAIAKTVAAANYVTWPFQYPVAWAMPKGQDLIAEVAGIAPLPLLLIHGRNDAVVPYRNALVLFAAAGSPRQLLSYNGGHIETFNHPQSGAENRAIVMDFILEAAGLWRSRH
ncbi:alpha/beta hydrolase [Zhongshania sp.]|uniref:alpha/beta hydrolase n=1 Tax=Zhongshania sp. TaxID=1971902 RepID=UPI0035671627